MIQIILVDDEPLALEYLKSLIEKREDYRVIGAYTDALQAVSYTHLQRRILPFILTECRKQNRIVNMV